MCLLSGLLEDALVHYTSAAEVLKQASDWLWYGNALEGLATTTVLIVFQHHRDQRRTSIPRNLSFTANSRYTIRCGLYITRTLVIVVCTLVCGV